LGPALFHVEHLSDGAGHEPRMFHVEHVRRGSDASGGPASETRGSEQRALRWSTNGSGQSIRQVPPTLDHSNSGTPGDTLPSIIEQTRVSETQLPQTSRRPPLGGHVRWFTHEQQSRPRPHEPHGALGGDRWSPEESGYHHIEAVGECLGSGEFLSATFDHLSTRHDRPAFNRGSEQLATSMLCIEQGHIQVRSERQQRDAGQSAARAEVEQPGSRRDRSRVGAGVLEMDPNVGIADEAEFDCSFDVANERPVKSRIHGGV
jgi:hypothetical protein